MVFVNYPRQWNTGVAFQGIAAGEEVSMPNGQVCSEFSVPSERDRCLRSAANLQCLQQFPETASLEFQKCYADNVAGYEFNLEPSSALIMPYRGISAGTVILIAFMVFLAMAVFWHVV